MTMDLTGNIKDNMPEKQNTKKISRVLLAAASSGSGKTMICCGLLHLLKRNGYDVTSYKCGPDYIDPMFHRKVIGVSGGNLDTFFSGQNVINNILFNCKGTHAVVEGVMGIYDGIGGISLNGSSYEVACVSKTPVILIVNGYGSGRTIISTIKGILSDDSEKLIKGIIFNQVTAGFYDRLKEVASQELRSEGYDIKLLGAIPRIKDIVIDSRHLGLVMPDEIPDILDNVSKMADILEEYIDMDELLRIMDSASNICRCECNESVIKESINVRKRLAVAKDDAFCFYYQENMKFLEKTGFELIYFSPLYDEKLPDNIAGVILGGGYPENHLETLSANISMLRDIREKYDSGLLFIAECGGFMYLHDIICDKEGKEFKMAACIKGKAYFTGKLVRFGYVEINDDSDCHLKVRGHEFHYYDSTNNGDNAYILKAGTKSDWREMHIDNKHILGFPHLYYLSNEECMTNFFKNSII